MPREFTLPGTRARYAPDRPFDVQHYALDLDLDVKRKSFSGSCTVRMTPVAPNQIVVELDAVELEISSVSEGDEELQFRHDGKKLRIEFSEPLVAGCPIALRIEYSATPRRGLYFVGPDAYYPKKPQQVWSQGQDEDSRYWFPCFDSPNFKATSELRVRVPKKWFALSNGMLVSDTSKGAKRTMHWRLDEPHSCYLITLAAGEFKAHYETAGDVEVSYFSEPSRAADCKRTLAKTPEMIEVFSEQFGVPYPYEKYAQVFVADFIFGGMENTTATTLTDSVLVDKRASIDFDMESLVCHELAHQWFGDLLTCRDWGEGWLNEGFATYSEYLWREHSEGRDEASLILAEFSEAYLAEDQGRYRRTIVTKRYDDPLDIFDRHLYDKAGRVVHMIRRLLGDSDFFASVQHYLERHRAGVVETRDLARAIDRACGRNLDWFFDQWLLEGSGHPELKVKTTWHAKTSVLEVVVEQTHEVTESTPLFRLPTELQIVEDGSARDIAIELREKTHVFAFPCESEPTQVILDPGKHLIAKITSEKAPSMWREQLAHGEEAIDRIGAAKTCGTIGGLAMERALIESLEGEDFWAVRAAAANALGASRSPRVLANLTNALANESHPKVRRAAAQALAHFRGNEEAQAALYDVARNGDASYFVEAEACASLGKTRSPKAMRLLTRARKRDSIMDIIAQKCCEGLGALGDLDAVTPLIAMTELGEGSFARRAAMRALATLGRETGAPHARIIRERLVELLRDPDFRVQMQAVLALQSLGDAAACGALQEVIDEGFDNRLKRRCREAVRALREATPQASEVARLREESDALKQQLVALTSRLAVLEQAPATRRPSSAPTPQRRRGGGKKTIRSAE